MINIKHSHLVLDNFLVNIPLNLFHSHYYYKLNKIDQYRKIFRHNNFLLKMLPFVRVEHIVYIYYPNIIFCNKEEHLKTKCNQTDFNRDLFIKSNHLNINHKLIHYFILEN